MRSSTRDPTIGISEVLLKISALAQRKNGIGLIDGRLEGIEGGENQEP